MHTIDGLFNAAFNRTFPSKSFEKNALFRWKYVFLSAVWPTIKPKYPLTIFGILGSWFLISRLLPVAGGWGFHAKPVYFYNIPGDKKHGSFYILYDLYFHALFYSFFICLVAIYSLRLFLMYRGSFGSCFA